MSVIWILFACSVVVLPATALLALHWAMRNGEFRNLPKTALSIFDEEEPVGRLSDRFPGAVVEAGPSTSGSSSFPARPSQTP
jgi:nitrogen fixation-related uncharacterized protein